jgi:hypothetical protein
MKAPSNVILHYSQAKTIANAALRASFAKVCAVLRKTMRQNKDLEQRADSISATVALMFPGVDQINAHCREVRDIPGRKRQ